MLPHWIIIYNCDFFNSQSPLKTLSLEITPTIILINLRWTCFAVNFNRKKNTLVGVKKELEIDKKIYEGDSSPWRMNSFQALISQLFKLCITAMINHVFICFSAVQIYFVYSFADNKTRKKAISFDKTFS